MTNAVLLILSGVLIAEAVVLFGMARLVVELTSALREAREEAHNADLRASERGTEASYLRAAADRWDSVDSTLAKARLARQFVEGGPGLPSLWLRDEADRRELLAARYRGDDL